MKDVPVMPQTCDPSQETKSAFVNAQPTQRRLLEEPLSRAGMDVPGFASSITEHTPGEETFRAQEESCRTIATNLPGMVYREHIRENGRMEFFNDMVASLTGYKEAELTKGAVCSIKPLMAAEDRTAVASEVRAAVRELRPFEVRYRVQHRDGSYRWLHEWGRPICDQRGPLYIDGVIMDITERKRTEDEKEKLVHELSEALERIKTLRGLLPICASCKRVRNDRGCWEQVEVYVRDRSEADFSHGLCPDCARKLYPQP